MITRGYGRIGAVVVAGLVVLATGCGESKPSSTGGRAGTVGTSYVVTVLRPTGGTITSSPSGINCGTAGTACGPMSFPWATTVTLTATPDVGNMLGTWAGDCSGTGPCILSTTPYGADKYVVAVFGPAGLTQHPNFSDNDIHGPAYIDWATGKPNTYSCPSCHGATYNGMGIAPSCNACHARALGVPNTGNPGLWLNECTFCHGAPPPPPPPGMTMTTHPPAKVTGDPAVAPPLCSACHPTTVDANGVIVPKDQGGTHLNGQLDGGGHEAGFDNPVVHGREFFVYAAQASPNYCQQCHGVNYGNLIVSPVVPGDPNRSCNTCHATAGWNGTWQTNCSFCHGLKSAQTQAGPYDVNTNPTWSAPPDSIVQRLGTASEPPERVGAHAAHLTATWAKVQCGACHSVPTTVTHISGRDVRATVIVTAPTKPPNPNAYDQITQTCATYCHDPIGNGATPSPAWTATGLACNGCHPVPPATDAHFGVTGADLTVCAGCHPNTINPDGTFNTVAAGHINGTVDSPAGHAADFFLPANHGSMFLNTVAGVSGSLNCSSCHTAYANCNACHANPAAAKPELAGYTTQWVAWQSNCTFCHGAKTAVYASTSLPLSAPPDDIAQRLAGGGPGNEVPSRTGQHSIHVLDGGLIPIGTGALPCSSCHTVPPAIEAANHITADRVAPVAITAAGAFPNLSAGDQAKLPSPLVTYDHSAGTCTGYCHGSAAWGGNNTLMIWADDFSTPIQGCNDCHGQPPPTGGLVQTVLTNACPITTFPNGCANHTYHSRIMNRSPYLYDSCANCHFGSANGATYNGLHVNGKADIVYTPSGTPGYKAFTATWDPVARTCTADCHSTSGTTTTRPW